MAETSDTPSGKAQPDSMSQQLTDEDKSKTHDKSLVAETENNSSNSVSKICEEKQTGGAVGAHSFLKDFGTNSANHNQAGENSSVDLDPCDKVAILKLTNQEESVSTDLHITTTSQAPETFMDVDVLDKIRTYSSKGHKTAAPEQEKSAMPKKEAVEDGAMCKMKKDDSGISVRESLTSDDSKCEDEDLVHDTSREDRPSVSTESEGLVADIDTEDSETPGGEKAEAAAATKSDTSDEDDEDDDDDEERPQARRLKRLLKRDTSSSSSSSSDDDDNDDNDVASDDSKSEKSEEEEEMEVDGDMPKDTWNVMSELHRRENGLSNRFPTDRVFRRHTMSSLRMVQRLKLQHKMTRHDGCVNALNFNKSGTLLASGSDDLNVVLWNWTVNKPYLMFDSGHRSNVFQSKFMPYSGDCHIVTCARDGQVRLAELSSIAVCKGTKKLAQHHGAAHKLALLQDSSHVFYSCGEDAVVFEIDLRKEKPNKLSITKENDKKVALYSIHSNPFKSYEYCVGGRDHFIRIYDKRMLAERRDHSVLKKFCPHHLLNSDIKANVTCAVYNYNGTEVLGTYNDEDIYLFDNDHSDGANFIHRYTGHRNNATVKGVNFYGPHSEFIISGSDCSNVFLWEKHSEKIVQFFHADDGGVVNVLEPHPHAPILATSGLDREVKVWGPIADDPTNLAGLRKLIKKNRRDREEDRSNEPEMIDGQMLWFLMQQYRRTAHRRARRVEDHNSSSSSPDSENDSDDSNDAPEPVQCVPS